MDDSAGAKLLANVSWFDANWMWVGLVLAVVNSIYLLKNKHWPCLALNLLNWPIESAIKTVLKFGMGSLHPQSMQSIKSRNMDMISLDVATCSSQLSTQTWVLNLVSH